MTKKFRDYEISPRENSEEWWDVRYRGRFIYSGFNEETARQAVHKHITEVRCLPCEFLTDDDFEVVA